MAADKTRLKMPGPLSRWLSYGLDRKGKGQRRKQLSVNLIACLGALAWTLNGIGYILFDPSLWPASLITAVAVVVCLVSPVVFARHEVLAVTFLMSAVLLIYPAITWFLGSQAGIYLYLFIFPAMAIVLLGSRHIRLVLLLGLLCAIDLAFCMWLADTPALPAANNPEFFEIQMLLSIGGTMLFVIAPVYIGFSRAERAEEALVAEHARSEALLYNLLPTEIAARLKDAPDTTIAESLDHTAILFADIVDFTPRSTRMAPTELVSFLNRIFSTFDRLAAQHGLEKIKTIGDAYMVASGLPQPVERPVHRVADMAFDMLEALRTLSSELGEEIEIRIGLHSGPVVAGVIGHQKLFYDVWGDTVNTASRMESHGHPGRIQVTAAAHEALKDDYAFERRGKVEIKGIGPIETWWLVGPAHR